MLKIKLGNKLYFLLIFSFFLQFANLPPADAAVNDCGFIDSLKLSGETPYMDSPVLISTLASQLTSGIKTEITITWLDSKQCLIEGSFSGSIYNNSTNSVKSVIINNTNTNDGKSKSKIIDWIPEPGVNILHYNTAYNYSSTFENCPVVKIEGTICPLAYKKEIGLEKNQINLGVYADKVALEAEVARLKIEELKAIEKAAADKINADKAKAAKLAADQLAATKAANDAKFYAGQKAANSPILTKVSLAWSKGKLKASWGKTICRNGSASVVIYKDSILKSIISSGNGNSNSGYLYLKAKKAKSYYIKLVLTSCTDGRTYSNI